jgi:hypothetical protein
MMSPHAETELGQVESHLEEKERKGRHFHWLVERSKLNIGGGDSVRFYSREQSLHFSSSSYGREI